MFILDSSASSPKCLIHLTACFRVSNDILNSSLSIPLLTLEPCGTERCVITWYSTGFVSCFSTRPKGLTMKSLVGGCCKKNGPDMRPITISLRMKVGRVLGDAYLAHSSCNTL